MGTLARLPVLPGPAVYVGSLADAAGFRPPRAALVNLAALDPAMRYAAEGRDLLDIEQGDGEPIPPPVLARYLLWMAARTPDQHVLVHCFAGQSRGPTFACAWLMHRDLAAHPLLTPALAWDRALPLVMQVRPEARPHPALQASVLAYFTRTSA
jgi:hypothetical protein